MRNTKTFFNSIMIMLLIICSYTISMKVYTKNGLMNKQDGGSSNTDKFVTSADYVTKCMKGLAESIPPGFCWKKGGDAGMLPLGCPAGYFRSMALCFELCPDGWSHILGICYKNCNSGYIDHGLTCFKHIFDFYFKTSYIPRSLTNFASEIPCPSGMYKSGALCYRDCTNIGMDNCGIGACIAEGASCTEEILKIANGVVEGVNTALWTILTMGASTAPKAAAKVTATNAVKVATKSSLKAGIKSMLNALKGKFKNFTIKKAKEKAKEFFKEQLTSKFTEVTVSTVCGEIFKSITEKEYTPPKEEEIGMKIIESVDIFGIKDIVEGCTDVSDGGAACGRSIVSSLSSFDPTGILSIAAVFIHPTCDVPAVKPPENEIADYEADSSAQTKILAEPTERLKYIQINTPTKCIWIFDQVKFEGNKLEWCADKDMKGSRNLAGTIWNNKVASFSVGRNLNGYFYEGEDFTGKFLKFTQGTIVDDITKFTFGSVNLKDVISSFWFGDDDVATYNDTIAKLLAVKNDRFNSVKAATPAGCVWVYDQIDLQGNKLEICTSTDLSKNTWNDKIISLSVGSNVNGFLYEGEYYSGRFVKFLKGTIIDNLGKLSATNTSFRNIVSSIYFGDEDYASKAKREVLAITPAKCIWLFDQVNFFGNKLEICSTMDLTGTNFDNKAISYSVGAEANAFLYDGRYFSGNFLKLTKGTANPDMSNFKSIISTVYFGNEDYLTEKRKEIAEKSPSKCIWAYDQINYQGNRFEICSTRNLAGTALDNKILSFYTGRDVDCYFFEGGSYMGHFLKFTSPTFVENILNYQYSFNSIGTGSSMNTPVVSAVNIKSVSSIWFGSQDLVQVMRADTYKYNYFLTAANKYEYDFTTPTIAGNSYYLRIFLYSARKISCLFRDNGSIGLNVSYDKTRILYRDDWPKRQIVTCRQAPPA